MKGVVPHRPDDPLPVFRGHFELLKNFFGNFGPGGLMSMGCNIVTIDLCHQWFANIMQKGCPEKIRFTIICTGLNRQAGMDSNITFGVILIRLGRI